MLGRIDFTKIVPKMFSTNLRHNVKMWSTRQFLAQATLFGVGHGGLSETALIRT